MVKAAESSSFGRIKTFRRSFGLFTSFTYVETLKTENVMDFLLHLMKACRCLRSFSCFRLTDREDVGRDGHQRATSERAYVEGGSAGRLATIVSRIVDAVPSELDLIVVDLVVVDLGRVQEQGLCRRRIARRKAGGKLVSK